MAITLIPNQQFVFDQSTDSCNNVDTRAYCQLVAEEDEIKIQHKQTPCGGTIVAFPTFTPSLGSELVVNGTFTGGAGAPWALAGGWAYNANNIRIAGISATGEFYQFIASLVAGIAYQVQITISGNVGTGTLQLNLSGNTTVAQISGDGTYTLYAVNGNDPGYVKFASVTTDAGDVIIVDNVSVKTIFTTAAWKFRDGGTVNPVYTVAVSDGAVCNLGVDPVDLFQASILIKGGFYKAVLEISNRTQGSVIVYGGTVASTAIEANGSQTVYFISDGEDLTVAMDEDFDGCINSVNIYVMRRDFQGVIKNSDGTAIIDLVDNIPSGVTLTTGVNEYVDWEILATLISLQAIFGGPAWDFGCYTFTLYNPCETSRYAAGGLVSLFPGWTASNPGSINSFTGFRGWLMVDTATSGATATAIITATAGIPVTNWSQGSMQMLVDVRVMTGTIEDATNRLYINLPNNQKILIATNLASDTEYTYHDIITVDNSGGATYQNTIRMLMEFDGTTSGNENEIMGLIVTTIPLTNPGSLMTLDGVQYSSNCFNYQQEHDCTKLLTGVCDEDNSLGFYFGGSFELLNRLRVLSMTPSYPDEEENYLYSSGRRSITYAQSEKYWILLFDYVDEVTHDNIRTLIKCDNAEVDAVAYYFKKGQYQPDWDKDGRFKLAQSRIEGKIKDQTLFNSGG